MHKNTVLTLSGGESLKPESVELESARQGQNKREVKTGHVIIYLNAYNYRGALTSLLYSCICVVFVIRL